MRLLDVSRKLGKDGLVHRERNRLARVAGIIVDEIR